MTEPLSSKPHVALRQAVEDLEAVERDSRYAVNMRRWHRPIPDHDGARKADAPLCEVCLAGAVMAKRLGVSIAKSAEPLGMDEFMEDFITCYLVALDNAREGRWEEFLTGFDLSRRFSLLLAKKLSENIDEVPEYEHDPTRFKRTLLRAADVIEEVLG